MTTAPADPVAAYYGTARTHTSADIPEYVIVREMDRAIQLAEDAQRLHDQLAHELGFERVRINDVKEGDEIRHPSKGWFSLVATNVRHVDRSGVEMRHVGFVDYTENRLYDYEDGELVSRKLPPENDVF